MSSRSTRLIAVIAAAAVAVTAAIAVSSSAAPDTHATPTVTHTTPSVLAGIPEDRGVLGDPNAKLTLTEFVDPQCPICAAASKQILPALLQDYVRTGKVKLDARVLQFLGPDSVTAARYAAGARQQNKLWAFLETLYANQGEENSGYMTPAFLASVARTAGVDNVAAVKYADTAAASGALDDANAQAKQLGVTGTPTFVLTKADGTQQIVNPSQFAQVLK